MIWNLKCMIYPHLPKETLVALLVRLAWEEWTEIKPGNKTIMHQRFNSRWVSLALLQLFLNQWIPTNTGSNNSSLAKEVLTVKVITSRTLNNTTEAQTFNHSIKTQLALTTNFSSLEVLLTPKQVHEEALVAATSSSNTRQMSAITSLKNRWWTGHTRYSNSLRSRKRG